MIRVNRSTLTKLCLLMALAVPVQRSAFATVAQGHPEVNVNRQLIAQGTDTVISRPIAASPDGELIATTDDDDLVIIEDAQGELVAGPLAETGGAVTALAFSDDGQILATGSETGQVRYWTLDGEPQGELFQAVVGSDDNTVTELSFEDDQTLLVKGTQGRQGFWGLDGLPPGESAAVADGAIASTETAETAEADVDALPLWIWLIPLAGIAGLGWLFLGKRGSQTTTAEAQRQTSPTATVPPPTTDPETEREVSSRAQTVISTDRVVDESRVAEGESSGLYESTDLESPNLEGTNLDLAAASMAAGSLSEGIEVDTESDDPWDDNLDDTLELTLDDEPDQTSAVEPPVTEPVTTEPIATESIATESPVTEPVVTKPIATEPPVTDTTATEPSVAKSEVANAEELPTELAESVVARSLEQEPLQTPAVETPAVQAATDQAAASTPVEPPIEAPIEALEAPAIETSLQTQDDVNGSDIDSSAINSSDIDNIEPTRDTVIAETETILDIEPTRETIIGDSAVIFSGAATAGVATVAAELSTDTAEPRSSETSVVAAAAVTAAVATEPATEFTTSSSNGDTTPLTIEDLASTDDGLADLPDGYGESRIVLLPRDPEWAYAYWDVSNEHKEQLRQQGGQRLMLRIYDVTDIDLTSQSPHSMQQMDCHEMARSWYIEMPVSDRDYIAEIGYLTDSDHWLLLARSAAIRVPPIYPSDWVKDQFVTINWQEQLTGRTFGDLGQPYSPEAAPAGDSEATDLPKIYDGLFALTQSQEALRVAGSLYGSMQQTAPGALSPSGGIVGLDRRIGLNLSGLNVSGLNMSGIGSGGFELPGRSRKFWLVAEAELIVYGATEPDATLTVGDKEIPLNPDGTFRFHVAFPDGQIDYPIRAVAADGEQSRSVHLRFERETPERNTNTKDEAKDEWF